MLHGGRCIAKPNSTYNFQIRKPLTPSSITTLNKTLYFKRLVTSSMLRLACTGFKQGIKNDVPRLNLVQSMSYCTFSIIIFAIYNVLCYLAVSYIETQTTNCWRGYLHAFRQTFVYATQKITFTLQ